MQGEQHLIKIGLPKGVVKAKSLRLVENILGYTPPPGRLTARDGERFEFFLLKHRDIPVLIENGKLDIGITSTEWIIERRSVVLRLRTLDWCDARISFIRHSSCGSGGLPPQFTCITEFPNIARSFLAEKRLSVDGLHHISGSTEALVPRLYDASIDCVETGQTLALHDLVEIEVIMQTRVEVIASPRIGPSDASEFLAYLA